MSVSADRTGRGAPVEPMEDAERQDRDKPGDGYTAAVSGQSEVTREGDAQGRQPDSCGLSQPGAECTDSRGTCDGFVWEFEN
jgi:hypothetical protein